MEEGTLLISPGDSHSVYILVSLGRYLLLQRNLPMLLSVRRFTTPSVRLLWSLYRMESISDSIVSFTQSVEQSSSVYAQMLWNWYQMKFISDSTAYFTQSDSPNGWSLQPESLEDLYVSTWRFTTPFVRLLWSLLPDEVYIDLNCLLYAVCLFQWLIPADQISRECLFSKALVWLLWSLYQMKMFFISIVCFI